MKDLDGGNPADRKGNYAPCLQGSNDAASGILQTERIAMAGMFELFMDADALYRFRLTAPDGTIMAVSKPFDTKSAAVAGIAAVREYAGMGLITDQCTTSRHNAPPRHPEASATHAGDYPRAPKSDFHTRTRAVRRLPASSRWARA